MAREYKSQNLTNGLTISFSKEAKDSLRKKAESEDRSMGAVVRRIVDEYFKVEKDA